MYRFFIVRTMPLHSPWFFMPRTYIFCNLCHSCIPLSSNHLPLRYQSSTVTDVLFTSDGNRRAKKKNKKYAELLQVTDSETNNKKAAVQNLNALQLSILVDQPDITLDKLHKIDSKYTFKKKKNKIKSFSTYNLDNPIVDQFYSSKTNYSKFNKDKIDQKAEAICNDEKYDTEVLVEDLKSSGIADEFTLIKSSSFANEAYESKEELTLEHSTLKLETSKEQTHLEELEEKLIDKERKAKEDLIQREKLKQFNTASLGFMNVCVNSDMFSYGKQILKYPKNKNYNSLYINDISVYNAYIEKLAFNVDLRSILQILQNLRKDKIELNVQTYMYIFYCIGRIRDDDSNKLDILKQIIGEMNTDGISLNDIITKSTFIRDQRIFVENMVKLLDNSFTPIFEKPDTTYSCRLLEKIPSDFASTDSTIEGLLNFNDLQHRLKKQIEMEIEGEVFVRNIAKQNVSEQNVFHLRQKLSNLESKWEKVALNAFIRNLATLKSDENIKRGNKIVLHPYLSILKPEDYVRVIIREVRKLGMGSEMYSLSFNSLCRLVGVQVYKIYEANLKQKNGINEKISEVYLQYCDWFIKRGDKYNSRIKWTLLEHEANKYGVTLSAEVPVWQSNVHISIGKFLYDIIINDLKIDVSYTKKKKNHGHAFHAPAFFKIFRHSGVMLKEEVKPHPMVAKLYRDSQPENLTFDTTLVPSLCPPKPWTSVHHGGYIVTKTDIVRLAHTGNQQWERLINTSPRNLYPAFDSLNQLSSIPWTINSAVLDVAIKVFQNDGSVELNMPQPPTILPPIAIVPRDASTEEKKKMYKARIELKRKKSEMYSLWCDALYRLSLANHFRNEIFWLPHNMDFRGRVYPVPPHLNHLGSDLARSMLVFALKKPLGPNGLDWLKLHAVNLTGFKKKAPVTERLKYANENIEKIIDSAERPLTGKMWWATSDEPWQTLAACMEIAKALKFTNPEEFMSGFPIHQDGSCNGLQHYAALGRDQIGAESVNLYPSDTPQDVYSSVAAMVDERRKEDAKSGNNIAKILEGFINRKVIKQTVMTTVYGVTWFGAKLQIARQLKDIDEFPQEHLWPASTYLVQKTFQTLRTMFKSAREIQDWFTECARLICITRDQNMEWVTPLGLPVIQPYSKVNRSVSNKNIYPFFTPDIYRKPNVMKQKNAFAPNFVHSLDSSHMMLTSIHSEYAGITFVSVHDCYWTHACTVEIMNKVCREQFVALHSEPILEDLSEFLVKKFAYDEIDFNDNDIDMEMSAKTSHKYLLKQKLNATLRKVPEQGDFDLQKVLSSTYFFS